MGSRVVVAAIALFAGALPVGTPMPLAAAASVDPVPGPPSCSLPLAPNLEFGADAVALSRGSRYAVGGERRTDGVDVVRHDIITGARKVIASRQGNGFRVYSLAISDDGAVIAAAIVDNRSFPATFEQLVYDDAGTTTTNVAARVDALVDLTGDGATVVLGGGGFVSTFARSSAVLTDFVAPSGSPLAVRVSAGGRYVAYASDTQGGFGGASTVVLDRHQPVLLPPTATTLPGVGADLRMTDDGQSLFFTVDAFGGGVGSVVWATGTAREVLADGRPLVALHDVTGDGRYVLADNGAGLVRVDLMNGQIALFGESSFFPPRSELAADGTAVLSGVSFDLRRAGIPAATFGGLYFIAGGRTRFSLFGQQGLASVEPPSGTTIAFDQQPLGDAGYLDLPAAERAGRHTIRLVGTSGCEAARAFDVLRLAFKPTNPTRLLDTRPDSAVAWTGSKPQAGDVVHVNVPVERLDPALPDTNTVVVNVTAVDATNPGFVTVYDCNGLPPTSNLNVTPGNIATNLTTVLVDNAGDLCLYVQSGTHLVVDMQALFLNFGTPSQSVRLLDTRADTRVGYSGTEPAAGDVVEVSLPPGVRSAVLNVTGVDAMAAGFVTAYPCGSPRPVASNLNLAPGAISANLVMVAPGVGNRVCLYTQSGAHLIADQVYLDSFHQFEPRVGQRLLDTRPESLIGYDGARPGEGAIISVPVPAGNQAVVLNVTVTGATAPGFVTIYPCGTPLPLASNLNALPGAISANLAIVQPGVDGRVCLYTQAGAHLVVDLAGTIPA